MVTVALPTIWKAEITEKADLLTITFNFPLNERERDWMTPTADLAGDRPMSLSESCARRIRLNIETIPGVVNSCFSGQVLTVIKYSTEPWSDLRPQIEQGIIDAIRLCYSKDVAFVEPAVT